jgi:hypothetical protein
MTEFELTIDNNNFDTKIETVRLLAKYNYTRISLTNKHPNNDLINISKRLWSHFPDLHISLTYSVIVNYDQTKKRTITAFHHFFDQYNELPTDK